MQRATSLKLLAVALLLGGAVASLVFLPVQGYLFSFLKWIDGLGPWGAVWVAIVYIPACLLFVPGALITLGAGFAFGPIVATIAVSVGSTAGATAAFVVGRTLGRKWVEGFVADKKWFHAVDRAVAESGFKVVLLTRLSPLIPFNALNYAFGLTQVSLGRYVFASWIGMLPGTIMYAYLGSAGGSLVELFTGTRERTTGEYILFAFGLVATIAVAVIITRTANRTLKEAIGDDNVPQDAKSDEANAVASDRQESPADES